MFKEYADDRHRKQAEEFIFSLGKFVIEFERICDSMRFAIMFMLQNQGLKNSGMEQVIIGDKAAAELRELLGALYNVLPDQDDNDTQAVRDLLKSIAELTEKRNVLLHCNWNLGTEAAEEELYAATVRFRAKQNKGAIAEVHGYSASYINELGREARRIQVLLSRMQYCICQSGFKLSEEFGRAM